MALKINELASLATFVRDFGQLAQPNELHILGLQDRCEAIYGALHEQMEIKRRLNQIYNLKPNGLFLVTRPDGAREHVDSFEYAKALLFAPILRDNKGGSRG